MPADNNSHDIKIIVQYGNCPIESINGTGTCEKYKLQDPDDCDKSSSSIVYDESIDQFLYFWNHPDSTTVVTGEVVNDTSYQLIYEYITFTWGYQILDIKTDSWGYIYVMSKDGDTISLTKFDPYGTVIWTRWIENASFISLEIGNDKVNVYYKKTTIEEYWSTVYVLNGDLEKQELQRDCLKGSCLTYQYINNRYYVAVTSSGTNNIISWEGDIHATLAIINTVKIKLIEHISGDVYLVSGDLEGTVILDGQPYTSINGQSNSIFIWYNVVTGQITHVKLIETIRPQYITDLAFDGFDEYVYTGYYMYQDSTVSDTCHFVDGFQYSPPINTLQVNNDSSSHRKADISTIDTGINFYPNPFNNGINIRVRSSIEQKVPLVIYNLLGEVVYNESLQLHKGINDQYITESEILQSGVYLISFEIDDNTYNGKIIKVE
jgi:hypothetical protein